MLPYDLVKPREASLIMEAVSHLSDAQEELRLKGKPEPPQINQAKELLIEAFKQVWER
ncbi:MAG: hypothetical protein JRD89_20370 [Deltaproteobacteria bacterium]|nr:hypothetical protein [Deltaproteobacteria bacterium]